MTDWLRIFLDVEKKKPILVNLQELIKSRALLQANSGGGKSHAIRKGVEEAYGKVQQIIIDPEGEFPTLREHYSFLLVGKGPQADIQIDSKHAALLARRIMETGADVIIDLYELNPFERIRFVKLFCEALINLPKTLWHQCLIWLDEIHVFAPESRSGRSESLAAVAALASRGRKRGYGLIGATQRISKLNKDVAAELNTKFIGRCSLDVDRKRAGEELGIKDTTILRKLKHEFYAFGPAIADDNVLVKAYETKTSHEELGSIKEYIPANKKKITGLLTNFSELDLEVEQDLKTKEGLESKINELKIKLKQSEKNQPIIKEDVGALNKSWKTGYDEAITNMKPIIEGYEKYILEIKKNISNIKNSIYELQSKTDNDFNLILQTGPNIPQLEQTKTIPAGPIIISSKYPQQYVSPSVNPNTDLGRCEKSILETLCKFNKPCSRVKIGVFSGYSSKSGGFSNSISRLKSVGYVTAENGTLTITDLGAEQVVFVKPLPSTNDEILSFWVNKVGKCPGAILQQLVPVYPESVSRENVGTLTNYSPTSGGFSNAISKLRTLGLIDVYNGKLKATEDMFP